MVRISPAFKTYFLALLFALSAAPFLAPSPVSAAVIYEWGSLEQDTIWSNDDVHVVVNTIVSRGVTLTIEPGTVVKFRHSGTSLGVNGTLIAEGTPSQKIYFTSINDDSVGGDTNGDGSATSPAPGDWTSISVRGNERASFKYADIRYGGRDFGAFYNLSGRLTIATSTIALSRQGIFNNRGNTNVWGSTFIGNTLYAINNPTPVVVNAIGNYWGSPSGPSGGNRVSANVNYIPWLTEEPIVEPPPPPLPECCSSVAFLPGLEASRLYRDLPLAGETRLWDPPLLHSNSQLFLSPDGTPETLGIYTKDVIDETYGANIYKSFTESMDTLVSDGTITEWQPFPYDWRFDIDDIVEHPIQIDSPADGHDDEYSMIEEIVRIASSSPTKRVTIIAHSNGGLIGKTLISKLEELGKGDIVDKFIMVAVPQLGTPKAITSMLHGEGLPTSFPVLLSQEDSRILAENMPSAYNLLPSAEYLNRVIDPIARFDPDDSLAAQYIAKYNIHVGNYAELHDFLLGAEGRMKPDTSDLFRPNILNSTLLSQGESNHTALDSWTPPAGVEVIQIAGWGLDTIKGIKYAQKCIELGCILDPEPEFTSDGDETVVTPSAVAMATSTYWVNLRNHNAELFGARINRKHADIFEATPVDELIKDLIEEDIETITHVTTTKPIPTPDSAPSLRLKVFSPVSLDLYDSFGNHTGISTTTLLGDMKVSEEQITNSYYLELGEGKYAGAEKNGTMTVELLGQDFGTFTFIAEEVRADEVVASTTFAGIPVTASTTATFTLSETDNVASTTLAMDIDGDGTADVEVTPGDGVTEEELLAIFKVVVKTLGLPDEKEKKFLKAMEKLEKELEKERNTEEHEKVKTSEAFDKLIEKVKKLEEKEILSPEEAGELISMIEQIRGVVVE